MTHISRTPRQLVVCTLFAFAATSISFTVPTGARSQSVSDEAGAEEARRVLAREKRRLGAVSPSRSAGLEKDLLAMRKRTEEGTLTPRELDAFFDRHPALLRGMQTAIGDPVGSEPIKCEGLGSTTASSKCKFLCWIAFAGAVCALADINCECEDPDVPFGATLTN